MRAPPLEEAPHCGDAHGAPARSNGPAQEGTEPMDKHSAQETDAGPLRRARTAIIWGAVLIAAAAAWIAGFLAFPWWIALLVWWWPSVMLGAAAGFLALALSARLSPRTLTLNAEQARQRLRQEGVGGAASGAGEGPPR